VRGFIGNLSARVLSAIADKIKGIVKLFAEGGLKIENKKIFILEQ